MRFCPVPWALYRGFIHVQNVIGEHLSAQEIHHRLDQASELDHPESQCRPRDLHADALEDLLLAIDRQSVLVFTDRDIGGQLRRG